MDVETAKKIFSAAEYLEQAGKIEQAIACYQQATKLHPEHFQYHYQLATILRQQGKLELAIQSFHQAISINPQHSWSYYGLGKIYEHQQAFDTAIEYYQKAIEFEPQFSWSHYNLGRIFHQKMQFAEAKVCYQAAIKLEANFDWSHYFLAEVLNKLQESEAAVYHYQKSLELNPQLHESHYALGRYAQNRGELERAAMHYSRAIAINPQEYIYYDRLGKILIEVRDFMRAIDCYEKAIALQPNNLQTYFYLGSILINLGQDEIEHYRDKVKAFSSTFRVNFEIGLAQAWQQLNEFSQAIKCCQNAIQIDPIAEISFKILQYIPTEQEELEQLINFYRQIEQSNRVSPLLWGNLGDLLTKKSKIAAAIDCYRTSCYKSNIIKNPDLAKLNWHQDKQKAPDFIIIGATKCGTTSLFSYLNQHPQMLAPHRKEINFFNRNFDLGLPWYLAQFPAIADAPEFITGEASPFYIYDERAIDRIKQLFPDIKLIAMLRNPVERTISEYYHAVNHGIEKRSLEHLIELEREQLATYPRSEAMQTFGYLKNSIYIEKIAKWRQVFPTENIMIIKSESFFEAPAVIMNRVCQFLNISQLESEGHIAYNVGTYPPVSLEVERRLKDFFIPYNQELAEYLDTKFDWE